MWSLESLDEINRAAYTLGELGMSEVHAVNICTKPMLQKSREKFRDLHKLALQFNEVVNIDRMLTERGA